MDSVFTQFLLRVAKKKKNPYFHKGIVFFVLWIYAFFIHSYPGAVLGFLSVIGLTEKLYKILYTLSVVFSEILAVPHAHQLKNGNKVNFRSNKLKNS